MSESWLEDEGAQAYLKQLKRRKDAWLVMLIGIAQTSTDPAVRQAWSRWSTLNQVIEEMEAERASKRSDGE